MLWQCVLKVVFQPSVMMVARGSMSAFCGSGEDSFSGQWNPGGALASEE